MKLKLGKDATIILIIGMLFTAGLIVASSFANVYLIRLTNDIGLMILQNIGNYFMLLLAFVVGAWYVGKGGNMLNLLRLGIACVIVYYTIIILLKENAIPYLIYLGLFNGFGSGFYYFTFNVLVGKLTKDDELPRLFSYQSSFSYIFGVLAPSISGYIIVAFSELTGYYVLFAASVFVFVLSIIFSFSLKHVMIKEKYSIVPVLTEKGNKDWDVNKYLQISVGLREAIYGQIFTVFSYLIITNEQVMGNLSSVMSLIGVASSLLIASKFTTQNQKKYYLLFALLYGCALSFLGISASKTSLYVAYIVLGVVSCWGTVIFQNLKYQLASRGASKYHDSDYIIATEFPMALGRIGGLFLFYVLTLLLKGLLSYQVLLVIISLCPLLDYFVINKTVKWLQE